MASGAHGEQQGPTVRFTAASAWSRTEPGSVVTRGALTLEARRGLRPSRGATFLRRGDVVLECRCFLRRDRLLEPGGPRERRKRGRLGTEHPLEMRTAEAGAGVVVLAAGGCAADVAGDRSRSLVLFQPVARPVRSRAERTTHEGDRQEDRRKERTTCTHGSQYTIRAACLVWLLLPSARDATRQERDGKLPGRRATTIRRDRPTRALRRHGLARNQLAILDAAPHVAGARGFTGTKAAPGTTNHTVEGGRYP